MIMHQFLPLYRLLGTDGQPHFRPHPNRARKWIASLILRTNSLAQEITWAIFQDEWKGRTLVARQLHLHCWMRSQSKHKIFCFTSIYLILHYLHRLYIYMA